MKKIGSDDQEHFLLLLLFPPFHSFHSVVLTCVTFNFGDSLSENTPDSNKGEEGRWVEQVYVFGVHLESIDTLQRGEKRKTGNLGEVSFLSSLSH